MAGSSREPIMCAEDIHHRVSRRIQAAADGPAMVLAVATAVPPFVHPTSTYPDYYFDMTNCNHMTALKDKFQRICGKLEISKRHMVVTKELLQEYPSLASYLDNSMSDRHKIVMEWIPKLSTEAAEAAIAEWGGSKSAITHIVMVSTSVVNMPGVDLLVANALGLDSSKLQRVMMYYAGCWGGGAALRIAKDLAENNKGARVLVVCADCTAVFFRAPSEEYLDGLVGQGLFGDGAAAVIVGADLHPEWEKPLFQIQWAGTAVVPDSLEAIAGHPMEAGLHYHLSPDIPKMVSRSLEQVVKNTKSFAGNPEVNDMFWALHPGGAAILRQIETQLKLSPLKLKASRQVLDNYGNMSSACVLFVLDQIRKNSIDAGATTTGEGNDFGLLIGVGPGLTVETLLLRSIPLRPPPSPLLNGQRQPTEDA